MPTYRDRAVVLRTHKLGESDRIITLLSRSRGKIRAVARGVRRTSSKFGARLEPFSHIDVQFAVGRNLDVVAQCETLHAFGRPLATNYPAYTAGQVMLETADRLVTVEGEPAIGQYRLLVGALWALGWRTSDGPRPPAMILDSFLLRSLSLAGYAPSLSDCAHCGSAGPLEWFSPESGGAVCVSCKPPGAAKPSGAAWGLMISLLTGDWPTTRSVSPHTQAEVSGLVSAFVNWHLERGLRALPMVDRR
ncbi:DNA repair protein RecO [Propionimicrobium lymphophilum]|uniref:DNA repair protein RecO n=1 Tax=Propionimicrobium lymphophilum TaxID=33012 RepID=UPI00040BE41D|nr:DNA repair protein RecO [Propionimicrobium lymphophilum]